MAHIFIINVLLLFSLSLNAANIQQVFGGKEPASDPQSGTNAGSLEAIKEEPKEEAKAEPKAGPASSQKATKAETLFGNSSSSFTKEAEPEKETSKQETSEGTKEEAKTPAHHRATAVFGRSSSAGPTESSSSGGRSRAASVFGTNKGTRPQASGKAEEKEGQGRGNEAAEHENPRSAPNYMWPVDGGRIGSFYGWRSSRRFHDGIDIVAPSGTKVFASKSGEVIYSGNRIRGYGNMVVIRHNGGYSTVYAHNKTNLVNKGDIVRQGDIIAHVGSTGHSSGPHSHFEVRKGKYSADPLKYLSSYDVKKHSGSYANSKDNPF